MNVDFKIGKHVGMVVTDLKEPDLTEGMSVSYTHLRAHETSV